MKNLLPLNRDAKDDLLKILAEKKNTSINAFLKSKSNLINEEYIKYESLKSGERIDPLKVTTAEKNFYKSLYKSKTQVAEEICNQIVNSVPKIFSGKCIHCFIGNNEELDHFLPINHYPYLSIFHLNLVPICGVCNKKKGDDIPGKKKDYLHPYFDRVPSAQYLKCKIIINRKKAKAEYFIDSEKIKKKSSRLIEHYNNLNLLERFKDKSAFYFSRIYHIKNKMGSEKAKRQIETDLESLESYFGKNHWNVVLCKEMIEIGYLCQ